MLYDVDRNLHSQQGARSAYAVVHEMFRPNSLLDVGCGPGFWMLAALEKEVSCVAGVDWKNQAAASILSECITEADLRAEWCLAKTFDLAICLEVAEHLPEVCATQFIERLTQHARCIVFSAACPGQLGQNHVNCRWPEYWQGLFNKSGFLCSDDLRWRLWGLSDVEPWYRQNIFTAKYSPTEAGREPRIRPLIHPEMLERMAFTHFVDSQSLAIDKVANGRMPLSWYAALPLRAAQGKLQRLFHRAVRR